MKFSIFAAFKIALMLILIFVSFKSKSQSITNKEQLSQISRTYGYLLGQDFSLDRIEKEYPELHPQITQAKGEFKITFGNTKDKIRISLKEIFDSNFADYEQNLNHQLDSTLGTQIISKQLSINFINEVLSRSKGNIPSPVLETLLIYQYYDNIEEEFTDGYTSTFKTKGHAKSKNTDWKIKIPKSWKSSEAERPNIIQKFTSDYGHGNYTIMLMVKDLSLPKGYKISEKEILETFSPSNAKDFIPEGGILVSHKRMTIDNQQGMMIESSHIDKRLDLEIKFRMIQYIFIYNKQLYLIQGMIAQKSSNISLEQLTRRFEPLLRLIANSVVINSQY